MATDAGRDGSIHSGSILGVRVDDVTYEEALKRVERCILAGAMCQIATVNVEFIMEARRNPAFHRVLTQAGLCVPESIGVMWAARRRGNPLRERVAGVDLVERIVARGAQQGWRVFFLGAAPGVAEQAACILSQRYAGLTVAGCYAGSPRPENDTVIAGRVQATRPDVLFVAYGAPSQDLWIARNQARIGVPVAIGVGGSFDFFAGAAKRPPRWTQRAGLEWLYRLLREPWRLRRQMVIPHFMLLVLMRRA